MKISLQKIRTKFRDFSFSGGQADRTLYFIKVDGCCGQCNALNLTYLNTKLFTEHDQVNGPIRGQYLSQRPNHCQ